MRTVATILRNTFLVAGVIFFILLISGGIHQREASGNCIPPDTSIHDSMPYHCKDTFYSEPFIQWKPSPLYKKLVALSILELYSQYKAECYRDSMPMMENNMYYQRSTSLFADTIDHIIDLYPQKEWIHRQPTFDGFMLWIEKNTK